MCVIAIVEDTDSRPTDIQVEAMYDQNAYGSGAAWRFEGLVHWAKGLDLKQIQELNRDLPVPYILHFRIPSCGGNNSRLCHPFPIQDDSPLDLTGSIDGEVLFHNGHWSAYEMELKRAVFTSRLKLPTGPWSDTRAMAWLSANFGLGLLDFIDEKIVVMGPTGDLKIYGKDNDWKYFEGKFIVSNTHWDWRLRTTKSIVETDEAWLARLAPSGTSAAHNQMVQRGLLPGEEESDEERAATSLVLVPKSPSQLAPGGPALDDMTFRRADRTEGSQTHLEIPLQEAKEAIREATGQGMETPSERRSARQTRKDSDGRSHESSGGDPIDTSALISRASERLREQWKWARSINKPVDPRVVLSAEEGERERRAEQAKTNGIIHLGRI